LYSARLIYSAILGEWLEKIKSRVHLWINSETALHLLFEPRVYLRNWNRVQMNLLVFVASAGRGATKAAGSKHRIYFIRQTSGARPGHEEGPFAGLIAGLLEQFAPGGFDQFLLRSAIGIPSQPSR